MAENLPISGLPTASILNGTEALPIVQSGTTKQATTQDLLNNVQYIQFDTTPSVTGQAGRMWWNEDKGTANIRLKGNNVTLQVGQELITQVYNASGADFLEANYPVVYISGSSNGDPKAFLAQSNDIATCVDTLGVVTETIASGSTGYVTTYGLVNDIDTSMFTSGDTLYLSSTTPGGLTNVRPGAPNVEIIMGTVTVANPTGSIYVNIRPGYSYPQYIEAFNTGSVSGSANTEIRIPLTTTNFSNGISIVDNTKITVSRPGVYSANIEVQLDKVGTAPSDEILTFWLKKGGNNVANSSTNIVLPGNQSTADTALSKLYYVELLAGEYIEFAFSVPDADIILTSTGTQTSPTRPAAPSVCVYVSKIA